MAKTSNANWAFVLGIVLAIILGIIRYFVAISADTDRWLGIILVILGLIIGFTNITGKEAHPFMIAGAILVIVSTFAGSVFATVWFVPQILATLVMLFTPAVIVTAVKAIWSMAASK